MVYIYTFVTKKATHTKIKGTYSRQHNVCFYGYKKYNEILDTMEKIIISVVM